MLKAVAEDNIHVTKSMILNTEGAVEVSMRCINTKVCLLLVSAEFRPEDRPAQGPNHVVCLIKDTTTLKILF